MSFSWFRSDRDPLTGVLSRAAGTVRLRQAVHRGARRRSPLSVLFLDIDRFKYYNDVFGHDRGDDVLRTFAAFLERQFGRGNVIRWAGDEFIVVLEDTPQKEARERAERALEPLREVEVPGDPPLFMETSAGLATSPDDAVNPEALVSRADDALRIAKEGGIRVATVSDEAIRPLHKTPFVEPRRPIELKAKAKEVASFLGWLEREKRGSLLVVGPRGAGHSRFLRETAALARMRGYENVLLRGHAHPSQQPFDSLRAAVISATCDALHRGSPPEFDPVPALKKTLLDSGRPVLFVVDDGVDLDPATHSAVQELLRDPDFECTGIAVGCTERRWPGTALPRWRTQELSLEPLSPDGFRDWLVQVLRASRDSEAACVTFADSLYPATAGRPGCAFSELRALWERGELVRDEKGQWRLPSKITLKPRREDGPRYAASLCRARERSRAGAAPARVAPLRGAGRCGRDR